MCASFKGEIELETGIRVNLHIPLLSFAATLSSGNQKGCRTTQQWDVDQKSLNQHLVYPEKTLKKILEFFCHFGLHARTRMHNNGILSPFQLCGLCIFLKRNPKSFPHSWENSNSAQKIEKEGMEWEVTRMEHWRQKRGPDTCQMPMEVEWVQRRSPPANGPPQCCKWQNRQIDTAA
jgi:hypothetical protein